jgi:hypothetical protein
VNEDPIARLERQLRALRRITLALGLALAAAIVVGARAPAADSGVLRVRGIVVEDSLGRERILIGAPIPHAANRVRTDSARVAATWAPRFPPEYLDWYRGYRHGMNGILVLDEGGFDRLAVGHDVPDPNIGRRIGRSTGVIVNDAQGFERSGYGLLSVDGADRVVLGLDRAGGEAVSLIVDEEGRAGLVAGDADRRMLLGSFPGSDLGAGEREALFGLHLSDGDTERSLTVGAERSDPHLSP